MTEDRWIMHGPDANDPDCIRSVPELEKYIEEVGFLPLFRNDISEWYKDGYRKTVRRYYPEVSADLPTGPYDELCLVIGLHFRQFRSLKVHGIRTVRDLKRAMEKPNWFRPLDGIGSKTAKDIETKLKRYMPDAEL